MKKVLIVTHLPFATPRIQGITRHLPDYGWEPIIITPPCGNVTAPCRVYQTEYKSHLHLLLRIFKLGDREDDIHGAVGDANSVRSRILLSLVTFVGSILNYPDIKWGWYHYAVKTASDIIRQENIKVIISSSSPVTAHIVAKTLKADYGIPWIADIRDMWSQNHNYKYGAIRRMVDQRLELKTLAKADKLVTVTNWAHVLRRLHNRDKVWTVSNGYNADKYDIVANVSRRFTITYIGAVYQGKQSPDLLFEALRILIGSGKIDRHDIDIRFYGSEVIKIVSNGAIKYSLGDVVEYKGYANNVEVLQKSAQLLLILDWNDEGCRDVIPGKVYEYMASKRPIMAIGGVEGDALGHILEVTKAGEHAATLIDTIEILERYYTEYKTTGTVACNSIDTEVGKYSFRVIAKRYAQLLDMSIMR